MTTEHRTISAAELKEHHDAGTPLRVLDVRSAAEFESEHIDGSVNVPLPLLRQHAAEVAKALSGPVVLACQSGVRATEAQANLAQAGLPAARVLTGGVPGYRNVSGAVVRGAQRWALERQVRMVAGSLVVIGLAGGRFVAPQLRAVAGAIGAGLTFSAATNTCAMGSALSKLPWNASAEEPTLSSVLTQLTAQG
ncbi:rhodanese-like domain-containing protein [Zhihengliuella flava]|uniref:Rhodanese-related sulfurtransferase n=1 Tax=Zhihengliuella flava TaxID=1285193 RepID=A0A931D9D5_9MICC|nr:rhodanese-like domain-containing protein [Zhihengliuella flava]MBG6084774.1 rhodanese-related sulfurtransferase [Zhihengliuella flava]